MPGAVPMPRGQLAHEAAPAAEKRPAAHGLQPAAAAVPAPETVPAQPGAQIVQAETAALPAAAPVVKMPAGQAAQPEALTVPEPTTAPKKPGAHVVQVATEPWPVADAVVVMPAGQGVHEASPAAAYEPAGQSEQIEGAAPRAQAKLPSVALRASTAVGAEYPVVQEMAYEFAPAEGTGGDVAEFGRDASSGASGGCESASTSAALSARA